jgi:hypothetical protein
MNQSPVVQRREIVGSGRTLLGEVHANGTVTLSVHPFTDRTTVSSKALRELADLADRALPSCRYCGLLFERGEQITLHPDGTHAHMTTSPGSMERCRDALVLKLAGGR